MPISNEELILVVRKGIVARDELYILEQGIERCTKVVEEYFQNQDLYDEDLDLSSTDIKMYRRDMKIFKFNIEKMRREALRLRSIGDAISSECMLVGFEKTEEHNSLIRQMGDDLEKQPSEVFIKQSRIRLNRIIIDGERAMEKLCKMNEKMIFMIAKDVSKGVPDVIDDLIGVANLAFTECAARTWDPDRGFVFSTYVMNCMHSKCKSYLALTRNIHIPNYLIRITNMLKRGDLQVDSMDVNPDERDRERSLRFDIVNCVKAFKSIEANPVIEQNIHVDDAIDEHISKFALRKLIEDISSRMSVVSRETLKMRVNSLIEEGGEPEVLTEIAIRLHEAGHTENLVSRQRIQQILERIRLNFARYLNNHDKDMIIELGISDEVESILRRKSV